LIADFRLSPYFFNAGLLYTSSLLLTSSKAFSKILTSSRIPKFDVIFGPAYKGISLAAITCMALGEQGIEMGYCYNRKEKKDVSSLPT
jgi:orotate phosphoribosyltransferase